MKIVLDTNIIISELYSKRGASYQLLKAAISGELSCAISGHCTHIITFNKRHFPMAVTAPYGIEVMTAGEFLKIWRDKQ